MKKWAVTFSLVIVLVYATLSVGASACLFAHQVDSRGVHHHSAGATHSPLCAWACQANQGVDLFCPSTQTQPLQLVAVISLISAQILSSLVHESAQSRAPPRR
jgi:hypothetical protein